MSEKHNNTMPESNRNTTNEADLQFVSNVIVVGK